MDLPFTGKSVGGTDAPGGFQARVGHNHGWGLNRYLASKRSILERGENRCKAMS